MNSNLSTKPGCAGTLQPMDAWRKKGLTCMGCVWQEYCTDSVYEKLKVEYVYLTDIEIKEANSQHNNTDKGRKYVPYI